MKKKNAEVNSTVYFLRLISFRRSRVIPEVLMQIHSSVRPHVCTHNSGSSYYLSQFLKV